MNERRLTLKSGMKDSGGADNNAAQIGMRVFDLLRLMLDRKRFILGTTLAVAVLTAGVVLIIPNRYESRATILPTGKSDKMAELRALAGLTNGMSTEANSSELFPDVLESQTVRDAVLARTFTPKDDESTGAIRLSEYYDVTNPDNLRSELWRHTGVGKDRKTGVITVSFTSHSPSLSQQVLQAYLDELENFNLYKRRSNAKDNANYLQHQMAVKQEELTAAEGELEAFQTANRDWAGTTNPQVLATLARFQRDVEIKNQTFLYLTKEFEIARFEAQKDVPIVRVLDPPSFPTTKVYPKRVLTVTMVAVLTFIIAAAIVMAGELLRQLARGRESEAFARLRERAVEEFPRVSRVVARLEKRRTPASV